MSVASNTHFMNNLFVSHGGQGAKRGFGLITYTNYSSSDYNGFYFGSSFESPFNWSAPPKGVVADYEHEPVARSFANLKDFAGATGQDAHSVMFDPASFVRFTMPNNSDISFLYPADDYDLRLKSGSSAIDKGKLLPNVTDGFSGAAPDIGAYEQGAELPHYGPRN
jgi:hypothetical protein